MFLNLLRENLCKILFLIRRNPIAIISAKAVQLT